MPAATTRDMSDKHEERLAEAIGGRVTRNSGATWSDQGDAVNGHDRPFAYCLDGKSTLAKSVTITLEMIEKLRDQAQGERPGFGLRWYENAQLSRVLEDWIMLQLTDFEEMLQAARAWVDLEAELGSVSAAAVSGLLDSARDAVAEIARLRQELEAVRAAQDPLERDLLDVARNDNRELREENDGLQAELATLRLQLAAAQSGGEVPDYIPMLPWTTVHVTNLQGRQEKSGVYYDPQGRRQTFSVGEIRVERMPDSTNRPRLVVNNKRVPHGDLYVDGRLRTRAAATRPSIEVG